MAKILKSNDSALELCKKALTDSKVIAIPTETVYGLAGNALDENAVKAIFEIKGRPLFNPLILHTNSTKSAENFAIFNPLASQLADRFWPGPLTMVLPKKTIVPNIVTANLDSVAIRCPQNQIFLKLLKKLPFPLAAPSANPFGYISPTSAEHVNLSLGDKLDYILDGDICEIGIESTIIDLREKDIIKVLRPGPITKEALQEFAKVVFQKNHNNSTINLRAPGMLKSHYSPTTPLKVKVLDQLNKIVSKNNDNTKAFIFQKRPSKEKYSKLNNIYWLSESGNESSMAKNFYQLLRQVDDLSYQIIYIEEFDDSKGLYLALRDRLSKAAK